MKATHKGTCQACGSMQRLPNGKLSNHGYSVKWNMFNGICQGSKELPFEKSKDLIVTFIQRAQGMILSYEKDIQELEAYIGPDGWHRAYFNGEYSWNKIQVTQEAIDSGMFRDWNKKLNYFSTYSYHGNTVAEVVKKMNKTRVDYYLRQIHELKKYIVWQEERIKDWKESELQEIK